jgi:hypothetical protein
MPATTSSHASQPLMNKSYHPDEKFASKQSTYIDNDHLYRPVIS